MKLYKRLTVAFLMASLLSTNILATTVNTTASLTEQDILTNFEGQPFSSDEPLNRAQFAQVLVNLMGYHTDDTTYLDVSKDKWYSNAVSYAGGLMYQTSSTFRPLKEITREEVAYALAKAYRLESDDTIEIADEKKIAEWALPAVKTLCSAGYISLDDKGYFNPKESLTGEECVEILSKMNAEVICRAGGVYSNNITGNIVINADNVTLKNMQIDGNLYLGEGCGNVQLENVNVNGRVIMEGSTLQLNGKCQFNHAFEVYANTPVAIVNKSNPIDLQIGSKSIITITGDFDAIDISVNEKINLVDAEVNTITCNDVGLSSTIDINYNSSVNTVIAYTGVLIQGTGKLYELISHSEDVSSTILPERVTGTVEPAIPDKTSWYSGFDDHDTGRPVRPPRPARKG